MNSGDRFEFVDISRWLPIRVNESRPLNEVQQSLPIHSIIENGVHKPFSFAIDLHRGLAEVVAVPEADPAPLVPVRNMGDGMYLHRIVEFHR